MRNYKLEKKIEQLRIGNMFLLFLVIIWPIGLGIFSIKHLPVVLSPLAQGVLVIVVWVLLTLSLIKKLEKMEKLEDLL